MATTTADNSPPAVAFSRSGGLHALATLTGNTVSANVTGADVAEVDFVVAKDDGKGGKRFLGAVPTSLPGGGGAISATWDKSWSVLTDGQTEVPLGFYPVEDYTDASGNPGVELGAPAEIDDDGTYQPATLLFVYDPATKTGTFLGAYTESTTTGSGELPLAATDKVQPMVVTVASTGDYTFGPGTTELTGANLALKATTVTESRLSVGFMATYHVGNVSTELVATSGSGTGGGGGSGGGKSGCCAGRGSGERGWLVAVPLLVWGIRRRGRRA